MILTGIMAVILRYFTEFGSFGDSYVMSVNVRQTHTVCNRTVAQRI